MDCINGSSGSAMLCIYFAPIIASSFCSSLFRICIRTVYSLSLEVIFCCNHRFIECLKFSSRFSVSSGVIMVIDDGEM